MTTHQLWKFSLPKPGLLSGEQIPDGCTEAARHQDSPSIGFSGCERRQSRRYGEGEPRWNPDAFDVAESPIDQGFDVAHYSDSGGYIEGSISGRTRRWMKESVLNHPIIELHPLKETDAACGVCGIRQLADRVSLHRWR